jgi:hypothetical protein
LGEDQKTKIPKNQQSNEEIDIIHRKRYKWPINKYSVYNFPGHKRNANQNYTNFISPSSPVGMTIFKNTENKFWQECRETGTLIHCW